MKKLLSLYIFFTLLLGCPAYAAPLYSYEEVIPISESISLRKVQGFYGDHDISYSVITADLSDEHTALRLLKSDKGVDVLDTVGNLASGTENVVTAMNADFFSLHKGNQGFSLGLEIQDGALSASPINPSEMATVSYINDALSMSYMDFHIMAVAPNWQYHEVRHLNKHTAYYGDILMYTSEFSGGMSPAPGGEVVEVVVSGGKITEFRRNMPPVEIPEDGCVLVVSEGVNMFFANNFAVGDPIHFDYYLTPDIRDASVAFGGGAMLVKDGKAVETFSHVISGYNPRSAIGTDKEGKMLYLVAVDGRQSASRGMSMRELALLMESLGCHEAVNLDGGGSTRLLGSTVWQESLHPLHSPTENRPVINAVGLTYDAPRTKASGILLEADKSTVFLGDSIEISAAVYDENMRPLKEAVTLSSSDGTINGNIFTPAHGGRAIVAAAAGSAHAEIEVFAVDTAAGIEIPAFLTLSKGERTALDIHVFDKEGHYVIAPDASRFAITSSNPAVCTFDGQNVVATGDGTAILSVSYGNATSYTAVAVGTYKETITDGFECENGSFSAYPATVLGGYMLSEDYAHTGHSAGRLFYSFDKEAGGGQAAHVAFSEPITLSKDATSVSAAFYTEEDFPHALFIALTDKNGALLAVPFEGTLQKGKWQTLTAALPKEAAPLRLDSIYVSKVGEETDGTLYIDDLMYAADTAYALPAAPQNVYTLPDAEREDFLVFAAEDDDTLLSTLINAKSTEKLQAAKDGVLLKGDMPFSARETEDALCISVVTKDGGIRRSDKTAWDSLTKAISETDRETVLLYSASPIFGADAFENRVLCDYLASLQKNVFVISRGETNAVKNMGGVYFITLGAPARTSLSAEHIRTIEYLAFSLSGTPSFTFKSLF